MASKSKPIVKRLAKPDESEQDDLVEVEQIEVSEAQQEVEKNDD